MSVTFRDSEQTEWHLRFTWGDVRDIRDSLGVDFTSFKDGRALFELSLDVEKLVAVLWLLVEKQAKAAEISPEEFAGRLDGPTLDAATEALIEAYLIFCPALLRDATAKVISGAKEAATKALDAVAQENLNAMPEMIETVRTTARQEFGKR